MRAGSGRTWLIALLALVIAGSRASAHRLDEYLQAARIAIEPDRADLELDLTPGVAVAAGVLSAIDGDADGAVSADEQHAYLSRILGGLALELDGRPLEVQPVDATFPDLAAFRRGEAAIRVQAVSRLPQLSNGGHQLRFRNSNDRDVSVYLANALVPESDRISVTRQRRDAVQSELTIDFVARQDATRFAPAWLLGSVGGGIVLIRALVPRRRNGKRLGN